MTPTQIRDRRLDIAGEIKQARAVVAECQSERERVRALYAQADEAHDRSVDRLAEKLAERQALADMAHADVLRAGDEEVEAGALPEPAEPQTLATDDPGAITLSATGALNSGGYGTFANGKSF